ncbi:right-handed parallel beta-helix repeat-containing protein [Paenibacillus marinisediminis]
MSLSILDIRDYGAVGDGATDCSNAIQQAVNNANGDTVYIPTGVFMLSKPIQLPAGRTVLHGVGTLKKRSNFQGTGLLLDMKGAVKGLTVSGIAIDGNEQNQPLQSSNYHVGVRLDSSQNVTFDQVRFYYTGYRSIDTRYCDGVLITNCLFENCGIDIAKQGGANSVSGNAISYDYCKNYVVCNNMFRRWGDGGCDGIEGSNITIQNNIFLGAGYFGQKPIAEETAIGAASTSDVIISGNIVYARKAIGIEPLTISGSDILISNNVINTNTICGIFITGRADLKASISNVRVHNNTIEMKFPGDESTGGIYVGANVSDISITGNTIYGNGDKSSNIDGINGITVRGDQQSHVVRVLISDNSVTGFRGYGIYARYADTIDISHNLCRDNSKQHTPVGYRGDIYMLECSDAFCDRNNVISDPRHSLNAIFINTSVCTLGANSTTAPNVYEEVDSVILPIAYDTIKIEGSRISFVSDLPQEGAYSQGDILYRSNPSPGAYIGWVCTATGIVNRNNWAARKAYAEGTEVNANGNVYRATKAGTSGSSAPSRTNGTIVDGTVHWEYAYPLAVFKTFGVIST